MATVLTCYYRPRPGGLCKRLFRALESLLASGHEVHYLAVMPFPIAHARCHFHRFPWPEHKTHGLVFWGIFHLLTPFQLLFLGFRHRVTHVFAFGHGYAFVLQPLRLLRRIPLTLFLRADALENHRYKRWGTPIIKLDGMLEGLAIAGVRLYGVSRVLTTRVVERHAFLHPSLAGTLPNDVPALPPHERVQTTASPSLRLACVGILEERKNQSLMIRCMAHLARSFAHLYLYGVGPEEKSLQKLAEELGVKNRVTFMGWENSVNVIWENVDLLLFPSLHEGAPNAILEALAYDVPVLASDIPEHREILPDCNLVSAHDMTAWVEILKTICADIPHSLATLREQQRAITPKLHFDWEAEIQRRILA